MNIKKFDTYMKSFNNFQKLVSLDVDFTKKNIKLLTPKQVGTMFKKICDLGRQITNKELNINIFDDVLSYKTTQYDNQFPHAEDDPFINFYFYHPNENNYSDDENIPVGYYVGDFSEEEISKLPAGTMGFSCNHMMNATRLCTSYDLLKVVKKLSKYLNEKSDSLNTTNYSNRALLKNNSRRTLKKVGLY